MRKSSSGVDMLVVATAHTGEELISSELRKASKVVGKLKWNVL